MKFCSILLFTIQLTFMLLNKSIGQTTTPLTICLVAGSIEKLPKDTVLNIGIRGNIAPLQWVRGIKLKDVDNDGIYSITIPMDIEKPTDLYFKFVLNEVEWESGDARKITLHPNVPYSYDTSFNYVQRPGNPFEKLIGEWVLKEDTWVSGEGINPRNEVKIPGHRTLCKEVNTDNSLLWEVNATSARGHILWVYDHENKKVHHVSSFMPFRSGVGEGLINEDGNVILKVVFEGEPKGTYRKYTYTWVNDNEYVLASRRFDHKDQPTGDFYGGTFIKIRRKITQ